MRHPRDVSQADQSLQAQENREYERYSCVLDVSCQTSEEVDYVPPRPARVLNISRGGVGLILYDRFEPGAVLTIGLTNTTEHFLPPLRVRVIHCREQPDGTWVVGCAFAKPLGDAELRALL